MVRLKSGDNRWMVTPPDGYDGTTYIGGRYVYEHRLLMEKKIGRLLRPGEIIHHKDGDRLNNNIENLELVDRLTHGHRHRSLPNAECGSCGKPIHVRPYKLSRGRPVFCSRSCIGKFYGRGRSLVAQMVD